MCDNATLISLEVSSSHAHVIVAGLVFLQRSHFHLLSMVVLMAREGRVVKLYQGLVQSSTQHTAYQGGHQGHPPPPIPCSARRTQESAKLTMLSSVQSQCRNANKPRIIQCLWVCFGDVFLIQSDNALYKVWWDLEVSNWGMLRGVVVYIFWYTVIVFCMTFGETEKSQTEECWGM